MYLFHPSFRPEYPEEEMDEENIVDDDSELTLGEIEKTMMQVIGIPKLVLYLMTSPNQRERKYNTLTFVPLRCFICVLGSDCCLMPRMRNCSAIPW